MFRDVKNFLNGAAFGMTLIVPGVSATILAIILGFYAPLLGAINHFRDDRRGNARYLAAFLVGVAAGAVLFSSAIMFLLARHTFPVMMFFIGLLAGSVPFIASKSTVAPRRIAPREVLLAAAALVALVALSFGTNAAPVNPEEAVGSMSAPLLMLVLLAGILNGATLVIPGLSGAFILLVMGLYPLVVSSISSIGGWLADLGNLALFRDIAIVLLPYGAGALVGCLVMARVMEKLMRDFSVSVHAAILGLILGSLAVLARTTLPDLDGASWATVAAGALAACAGFAAAFVLARRQESH